MTMTQLCPKCKDAFVGASCEGCGWSPQAQTTKAGKTQFWITDCEAIEDGKEFGIRCNTAIRTTEPWSVKIVALCARHRNDPPDQYSRKRIVIGPEKVDYHQEDTELSERNSQ